MKRTVLYVSLCLAFVTSAFTQSLSDADRDKTIAEFKKTKKELLKTVKGLTEEQLNYKPSAETWSVAECLEHITVSEKNLFGVVQMTLQSAPDPSQRADVKMSDDDLLALITDRSGKVKTRPEMEPTNQYGSYEGTLEAFKAARDANIDFVKSTQEDLRNWYFEFPFGKVDVVQVLLFIAGHSQRHTDQIKELLTMQSFPG